MASRAACRTSTARPAAGSATARRAPSGALHYELLDGAYRFQATYNGGSQQLPLTVDATHTDLAFRTRRVRVPVRDSDGDGIAGVVQNFYGSTGSWIGNRTTGSSGVLRYELLPGTYHFQATYNGGSQQQTLAVDARNRRLTFQTRDVAVALLDSDDDGVAGGVQNFYGSTGAGSATARSAIGHRPLRAAAGLLHVPDDVQRRLAAAAPGGHGRDSRPPRGGQGGRGRRRRSQPDLPHARRPRVGARLAGQRASPARSSTSTARPAAGSATAPPPRRASSATSCCPAPITSRRR